MMSEGASGRIASARARTAPAGTASPPHEEVLPGAEVRRGVVREDHYLLQVRQPGQGPGAGALGGGAAQGGDVGGAEEGAGDEQQAGAAALEDVRGLRALEAGVEGDEHRARGDGAEGGDDPLEGVGRPDGDPVAGLDPGGEAGGGRALDALAELGVADADPAVDDGFPVAVAVGGVAHEGGDGAPAEVAAGVGGVGSAGSAGGAGSGPGGPGSVSPYVPSRVPSYVSSRVPSYVSEPLRARAFVHRPPLPAIPVADYPSD